MKSAQMSARKLIAGGFGYSRDNTCTSCLHRLALQTRQYATSAATAAENEVVRESPRLSTLPQTGPQKAYRLMASPVLSRPPLLTRELSSFEKAFYLYQKRLNERLALPFQRYFYYKEGTPADVEWKRKRKPRKSAARDVGLYSGYGDEAWNDEVLVGDSTAEPAHLVDNLIRDAEGKVIAETEASADNQTGDVVESAHASDGAAESAEVRQKRVAIERPLARVTEADMANDYTSLDRKMDRTLYLIVKKKDGKWRFPEDRVHGRESLHQAAERILIQSAGINMNTWLVGNHPIGHYSHTFDKPRLTKVAPNKLVPTLTQEIEQEEHGEKVFFMKSRIMTGQADMSKNVFDYAEFRWVAKEEIKDLVGPSYWSVVKNMLNER